MAHILSHSGFRPRSRSSQFSTDTARPGGRPSSKSSVATSPSLSRSRGMAGVLDLERNRTRRDRTFIGSECAVCEEPLEHTLRGERILQLSCGHVSHEACFYEYIREFESQYCPTCNAPLALDTSRGGNVLDLGKQFDHVRERPTNRQQRSSVPSSAQCMLAIPETPDAARRIHRPHGIHRRSQINLGTLIVRAANIMIQGIFATGIVVKVGRE